MSYITACFIHPVRLGIPLYETVEENSPIPYSLIIYFAHFCTCTVTQILFIFVIVATEFELELLAY